jgi:hypothetical protein
MCNDCCGAKATRKLWRNNGDKASQSPLRKVKHPGNILLVDQLESSNDRKIDQQKNSSKHNLCRLSYVCHQTLDFQ